MTITEAKSLKPGDKVKVTKFISNDIVIGRIATVGPKGYYASIYGSYIDIVFNHHKQWGGGYFREKFEKCE